MRPDNERPWRTTLGAAVFAVSVGLPSFAKILRQYGARLAVAYLLVLGVAIAVARPFVARDWTPTISSRRAAGFMVATLALLAVAFVVIYPRVTSGSDRDEALDLATRELLRGHFPYYLRVYPAGAAHVAGGGHRISPMPGELLLAAPLVFLVGSAAWQTLLWLGAFFFVAATLVQSKAKALVVLLAMLLLGPASVHEIVTGGDMLANALWVLVFGVLVIAAPCGWRAAGASLLFGIGLSSRGNFVLLLPLVFVVLRQRRGLRQAAVRCATAAGAFAAVTAPFYVFNPAAFSPFHIVGKLAMLDLRVPHAVILTSIAAAVAVTAALWRREGPTDGEALAACALVLEIPVVAAVALACRLYGPPGFLDYGWYGVAAMPYGVLAAFLFAYAHARDRRVRLRPRIARAPVNHRQRRRREG